MEKGEEELPTLDLKDGNIQGTTDKSNEPSVSDDIETLFFDGNEKKPSNEQAPEEEKKSLFEQEQTNDEVIDTTKDVENKTEEPKKEETQKQEEKKEEPKKEEAPKQEEKKEEPKKEEVPKQEEKKEEPKKEEAPKQEEKKEESKKEEAPKQEEKKEEPKKEETPKQEEKKEEINKEEPKKEAPQNGEVKKPVPSQNQKPNGPAKPPMGAKQGVPNKPVQGGKPAPQDQKPSQDANGKPPEKLVGKPVPPPTGKPHAPVFEKESSAPGVPVSRAVIAERERKAKKEAELAAAEARRILEEKRKAEEEARLKAEEERKAKEEAKKAAESGALEPPKEEVKTETPAQTDASVQATPATGSIFEPGAQPKQNPEIIDTTGTTPQPNLQVTQPISIPIDPNNNGPIYVMIQNPGNVVQGGIGGVIPQNITIQPAVQNNQVVNPNAEPTLQNVQQPSTGTKNEGLGSYKLNSSLLNKLSSDENLLKEYVGNNYYKLSKGIINFAAFFFNSIYLLFRKMPMFALIVFALELLAICIINQPLVLVGVFLVEAVLFNKIYMVKSKNAIKRLRMKYADQYVLRRMCGKRGGTNFGFALIGVIFEVAAIFVLIFYGYGRSITKYLAEFGIDISISDVILKVPLFSEGSEEPSSYNGILIIDTNITILDELNVGVARSFKSTMYNNGYRLSYSYSDNTKRINKCSLKLVSVKKYNSSETLISQIAKHYGEVPDEVNNGWNNVKVTTKRGTTYYYSINKEDKVYLFIYDEENNAPQDCDSYREEVFSTIIFKDKMIESGTEETEEQKVNN